MRVPAAAGSNPGNGNWPARGVLGLAGLGLPASAGVGEDGSVVVGEAMDDALCLVRRGSLRKNAALDYLG